MLNIGRLRYLETAPTAADRPRGTLLLLHAFPLNARMWEGQLALADTGWRVIAPQLRGFDRGDGDPPAASEELHRAIAGSELVRIARAGHLSSLEQPESFNAALAAFLTHRV